MMQMQIASVAASYPGYYNIPNPQYRDRWGEFTRQRKAMTRSAHAICWRASVESEAMWRLYCKDRRRGQGLALRTTLRKLQQSVSQHDVIVSPVVYRYYHTGPGFTDDLDAFMHKRKGFEHESEVRLLTYDQPHYHEHVAFIRGHSNIEPPALQKYLYLDWTALDAIEAIVISPYATQLYEDRAMRAIEKLSRTLAITVELSDLSARRYEPHF